MSSEFLPATRSRRLPESSNDWRKCSSSPDSPEHRGGVIQWNRRHLRVLLVDGAAGELERFAAMARSALEGASIAVEHAASAADATRALSAHRYDVVLFDDHLHGPAGIDLLRQIRSLRLAVPVLFLTSSADPRSAVEAMKAGAADYLDKSSLTSDLLGRSIRYAVDLHDKERCRREAERALALNEAKLRHLIERSADGIILVDGGGCIRFVNPAAEALFARGAPDLLDQPFGFPVIDGETTEIEIVQPGRPPLAAEMRVVEMDWEGEVLHLATLRDITQRRRLEEQLRQSQKMEAVGRLAEGIAHDFNNLLTAITGYAELLLAGLDGQEHLRRDAQEIHKASDRAAALTRQLLTFSRKHIVRPEVLDLNAVVAELESMLRRILGEDMSLETIQRPVSGCFRADRGHIEQVIVNLVVNARDAVSRGGRICIETADSESLRDRIFPDAPPGAWVILTVTDNGCGMDAQTQAQMFEPFFTTKPPDKGTGLGLSIVYGIVQQCGGHIRVRSEIGCGTIIRVYFPRLARQSTGSLPPPQEHSPAHATVLLVEDQEIVRALVRRILVGEGYQVLAAANGLEALELCARHAGEIELLVTDVVMPHMSGRELAERLLRDRPGIRVIYVSGFTRNELLKQGTCEADDMHFLQKPFTVDALTRKVRQVLELRPLMRS